MLSVFKSHPEASIPSYSTKSSACFDLHACLPVGVEVLKRGLSNVEYKFSVRYDNILVVNPGERVLVPTGLIFDIPEGHSVRIHPRSGLAYKNGVCLSNCEGVIDEDYVDQVYVCLLNNSGKPFTIKHGDRIAQAEVCVDLRCDIYERPRPPSKKTNRSGGFGSTGV